VVTNPAITLAKTVGTDPSVCAATDSINVPAGTEVTYCFLVTNTGDVTLTVHTLVAAAGQLLLNAPFEVSVGASAFLTASAVNQRGYDNTAPGRLTNSRWELRRSHRHCTVTTCLKQTWKSSRRPAEVSVNDTFTYTVTVTQRPRMRPPACRLWNAAHGVTFVSASAARGSSGVGHLYRRQPRRER